REPDAEQQGEQGDQAQGGQGAGGTGGGDREALEPARVADVQADGHREQRGHEDPERGVAEVLEGAQRDPVGTGPAQRVAEPVEGVQEGVAGHGLRTSGCRVQGITARPSSTSSASGSRARAAVATMPAAISSTMPRRTPSTSSIPQLGTPRTPPTGLRDEAGVATTRAPARSARLARPASPGSAPRAPRRRPPASWRPPRPPAPRPAAPAPRAAARPGGSGRRARSPARWRSRARHGSRSGRRPTRWAP